MGFTREKLFEWRRRALMALRAGCITGAVSTFDQWLDGRMTGHLEFSLGFLVTGCLIF